MAKKTVHAQDGCPVCDGASKLPWMVMSLADLVNVCHNLVHGLVRQLTKKSCMKLGIVVVIYTETHHSTTVSNVPNEWLGWLGEELIRRSHSQRPPPCDEPRQLPAKTRRELN